MLAFVIRNNYDGLYLADSSLKIKTFSSVWSAERYMKLLRLKPEVHEIIPISVHKEGKNIAIVN